MGGRRSFSRKQLNDRRFRKAEEAILGAYFAADGDEKMPSKLARRAGISRTTIHRHHGTVFAIKTNYEKYLLYEYRLLMSKRKYDDVRIEMIFSATLIFMMINKKMFVPILKDGAEELVRGMMKILEPKIARNHLIMEGNFDVYVGEVYVVLWRWGKAGLSELEFKRTLDNLVYLTKTMGQRLKGLK